MGSTVLHKTPSKQGCFGYVEELIRSESSEKAKGDAFEKLCHYFLRQAPQYRGVFKHVWPWDEWPGRWGPDIRRVYGLR